MSSNNRTSSGVRNLRAMFENQSAANSPEPRGRSPIGSATPNPLSDPNRPTSKVRASFFSVEPTSPRLPKDLGTIKGTSDGINSPTANRRGSFSISQENGEETIAELKKVVSDTKDARNSDPAVPEPIPEQAVAEDETPSPTPPPRSNTEGEMPNLGSIMKGSDFPEPATETEKAPKQEETKEQVAAETKPTPQAVEEKPAASLIEVPGDNPDKVVSGVQDPEAALKPADPKDESAISGGAALPPPTEDLSPVATQASAPETSEPKAAEAVPEASSETSEAKVNGTAGAAPTPKRVTKKPAAISTSKTTVASKSSGKSPLPRSPAPAKLPKTPTTPKPTSATSTKSSAAAPKAQTQVPATKTSRASLKPSTTSATASTAAKGKAPVEATKKPAATKPAAPAKDTKETTQTSPFRKPKPKSPTRPARLPSHLTAPTAASVAKREEHSKEPIGRKSSTMTRPPPAKPAAPAATKKQPSRASLAPQPAKRPESRTSSRAGGEESFLARMMRPTASSMKKTHDKPASPPRRTASVKAPTKPKSGPAAAVAKGKQKVGEAVAKVKETVAPGSTDGTQEEDHPTEAAADAAPEVSKTSAETERAVTPPAQPESSSIDLQTPNFEGETIR